MSLLRLLDSVLTLSERLLGSVSWMPNPGESRGWFKCILLFFALRSRQTLQAIKILTDAGYSDQALALSRNIIEMAINSVFIATSPDELGQRYVEYHIVARKKWLDVSRQYFADMVGTSDLTTISDIENGALEFVRKYPGGRRGRTGLPDSWSGKSVGAMARETSGAMLYEVAYAYSCESAHPAIGRINDYFELLPGGGVRMKDGPDPKHQDAALANASTSLLLILSHLDQEFTLGREPEIEQLRVKFTSGESQGGDTGGGETM